jgi:hypothetical protein
MRLLRIGEFTVEVRLDSIVTDSVRDFVARITCDVTHPGGTHRLTVTTGDPARLVLDPVGKAMTLALPVVRGRYEQATVEIGLLQAATRGVAFIETATPHSGLVTALLHGGAVAKSCGGAVAVLDGGLGQGKTSLTMGLAARSGQLIVDEFTFATLTGSRLIVLAAPQLPWHVRPDMASHLLPAPARGRLLFPADLRSIATTTADAVPLRMILIPDRGLRAGRTVPAPPSQARRLLRSAVTDHLRKLADPSLDHVSIFRSAAQVTTTDGAPLGTTSQDPDGVLDALLAVPVIRVGIGAPADLPLSVTAAGDRIAELLSCHPG